MKIMGEHPSVMSRKEYLLNKTEKATNIINLKPERSGMIDKRIAENEFSQESEINRSVKIANNAKAMRLNRR